MDRFTEFCIQFLLVTTSVSIAAVAIACIISIVLITIKTLKR